MQNDGCPAATLSHQAGSLKWSPVSSESRLCHTEHPAHLRRQNLAWLSTVDRLHYPRELFCTWTSPHGRSTHCTTNQWIKQSYMRFVFSMSNAD